MNSKLVMKYPSTWHNDMWREGAPFGNGLVGGLVYGGAAKEIILINHAFLWRGGSNQVLPDVSDVLPEVRRLLDEHEIRKADALISKTLTERGYSAQRTMPTPVCDILIETPYDGIFKHYRRTVNMQKAEIVVSWDDSQKKYTRKVFASRNNGLIFFNYSCSKGTINTTVSLCAHDIETLGDTVINKQETFAQDGYIYFSAYNESVYMPGDYGAVMKITTDGKIISQKGSVKIADATSITAAVSVFVGESRTDAFQQAKNQLKNAFNYTYECKKHASIHSEIFNRVDFSLGHTSKNTCNEELLLEAFDKRASNELIEKLYAYGRYLFICSTSDKNTLPCHLTGLFNGTYRCFWAFNMFNVNFQMIYWHALSGNIPSFLRLALEYIESHMSDYRENAKKIFGCRGIQINSVNTPESGLYKCLGRHIVNWTGAAAWISQHFWDYYRYTGDDIFLREHALPFMYEVALFYEDFVVEAADGYYDLYPSVSPENTCANVMENMGLDGIETSKNATMEIALMKELFTNLLKGCEKTGMYGWKITLWKQMLSKIRKYKINKEGAIKEWIDDYYIDNYHHRHHSYIYPLFPGGEISEGDKLYNNFIIAEDMRLKYGLNDQCNWSVVYMACIAARIHRGDMALDLLEALAKTCLMNNFFTVSNDWRRMGAISCSDFRKAPFQIDGNIGFPAAVNELLLQSSDENICILPALPTKWRTGKISGLLACNAIKCDISWSRNSGKVTLYSKNEINIKLKIKSGYVFENNKDTININICGINRFIFKKE